MRRDLLIPGFVWLIIGAMFGPAPLVAFAIKPFMDEFHATYVKQESSNPKDQAFAAVVLKAKCNVCHEGTNRKNRNLYGQALEPLLDKTKDKADKAKIHAAIEQVAAKKSDPKNSNSPTFGDLIAAGKLPGGEPKRQ
jgi:hypothetical protein